MTLISLSKRQYEKNYVEKKKTDSGEVRIYDEKHIQKRWKQKLDKLKKLEKDISKLRTKYKEDLKSDDPKTRATAAIVGLMDNTAMRVGNDASVEEHETFGATTLKKKHATVKGNKIHFKFPGKKGVEQNVVLDDTAVAKEIKDLLKDKKKDDFIFAYDVEDGDKRVRAKVVNRYLKDFDITAKDLRGFQANRKVRDKMKKTKDFEKVVEDVAKEVGHEEKTLMNHYLDPKLVEKHIKKSQIERNKLIILADLLDEQGYFTAANRIDLMIKEGADTSGLIKINLSVLRKEIPMEEGENAREYYDRMRELAKQGPVFTQDVLDGVLNFPDQYIPQQYAKPFIMLIANSFKKGELDMMDLLDNQNWQSVKDYINATGNINSETTIDQLLSAASEWHQQFGEGDENISISGDEVVYQFEDGFTMVKVSPDNLDAEGQAMGHCVGGYCEQVEGGDVTIYSLRDPQGKPHVTIEVDGLFGVEQIKGKQNDVPAEKYHKYIREWLGQTNLDYFSSEDYISIATEEELKRVVEESTNVYTLRAIAEKTMDPELQMKLAKYPHPAVRAHMALYNPNLTPEAEKILSEARFGEVRGNLAKKTLNKELQEQLVNDRSVLVLVYLARNPNLHPDIQMKLAGKEEAAVLADLASNPNLTPEAKKKIDETLGRRSADSSSPPLSKFAVYPMRPADDQSAAMINDVFGDLFSNLSPPGPVKQPARPQQDENPSSQPLSNWTNMPSNRIGQYVKEASPGMISSLGSEAQEYLKLLAWTLATYFPGKDAVVTSGARSGAQQARIMAKNWARHGGDKPLKEPYMKDIRGIGRVRVDTQGMNYLIRLYGNDHMAYQFAKSMEEGRIDGVDPIKYWSRYFEHKGKQGHGSRHLSGGAIDFRTRNRPYMRKVLEKTKEFADIKIVPESDHVHVAVNSVGRRQPNV